MEKTTDKELRTKIEAHLKYEEQGICLFKENKNHRCVYLLKEREEGGYWDDEYLPCGYFFDWEAAFRYGDILMRKQGLSAGEKGSIRLNWNGTSLWTSTRRAAA